MDIIGDQKIKIISEDYFNQKTKHLNYFKQYVSQYEALVIKGDDSLYYINQRGKCYIIQDLQAVDSFLEQSVIVPKPKSYYKFIQSLGNIKIDSIQHIIDQFKASNNLGIIDIDQDAIYKIDEIVIKMSDKNKFSVVMYCIVGEYFRYAFSNGYSWANQYNPDLNVNLPVLIENATGKLIRFDEEVFDSLSDPQVETPVNFAVHAIFYKL